jgi:L-ribulose-5-phosphate 3-epimerase
VTVSGELSFAGIGDEAAPELAGQLAAIRELGWHALELRTIGGVALADLPDREFHAVAESLRAEEISVPCVDSRIGNWARPITTPFHQDLAELDILARRCAELGARYVRIMSYPNDGFPSGVWRQRVVDRIRRLTERAERAELVLLHENCSGWAGASAERTLDLIEAVDSPALRVLFDTGNGVAHGYPGIDLLRGLAPYVEHVHVKDAVSGVDGAVYTVPGAGQARVADCLRLLIDTGYSGFLSIEPHLSIQPHAGHAVAGGGTAERFVWAGRCLERLVRGQLRVGSP